MKGGARRFRVAHRHLGDFLEKFSGPGPRQPALWVAHRQLRLSANKLFLAHFEWHDG